MADKSTSTLPMTTDAPTLRLMHHEVARRIRASADRVDRGFPPSPAERRTIAADLRELARRIEQDAKTADRIVSGGEE